MAVVYGESWLPFVLGADILLVLVARHAPPAAALRAKVGAHATLTVVAWTWASSAPASSTWTRGDETRARNGRA